MSDKILKLPKSTLIEIVAANMAATFYEIGRGQGLASKHKNARSYAKANLEKFIPHALKHLIDMLARDDIPNLMKEEIHEAIIERANDPTATAASNAAKGHLPDINLSKIMPIGELPTVLKYQRKFDA